MTEEMKVQCPSSSPRLALGKWLTNAMLYGSVAGYLFSGVDVDFVKDCLPGLLGALGMVLVFGLPAGIILGFLDSIRGQKSGSAAVIKVPAMMFGGLALIVGVLAIPIVIGVAARFGSEWLTGGVGNNMLRNVIGTVAGASFGLMFVALHLAEESIRAKWHESRSTPRKLQ